MLPAPTTPLLLLLLLLITLTSAQSTTTTTTTSTFAPTVPATTATTTAATTTTTATTNTTISCPALHHDCSIIGRPDACCTMDQVCVFDDNNRLACCPFRTKCVGTLDVSEGAAGSDGGVVGMVVGGLLGLGAVVGFGW